jgi:hypothetical protein
MERVMQIFFPSHRLGTADYIIGALCLAACFVFFFHDDITLIGAGSLNYLFGRPLDFYENCMRIHGSFTQWPCPYPPSTYLLFALWLYPFKLFGIITSPEQFSPQLVYWLKLLTTMLYAASGIVFYQIAREYGRTMLWAKYATAVWLTAPLALFSQLIFSQCDVFYVILTLAGVLMFLRKRSLWASALFALAITFKYFPVFVFLPLLLLYEKRLVRVALCAAILVTPTVLINVLYGSSPAFISNVRNFMVVEKLYGVSVDLGGAHIYLLPACFALLCGAAYFLDVAEERRKFVAAYLWLIASVLPFLFIVWHPQWVIFFTPAIVLSSMLSRHAERFLLLDLLGMLFFVAAMAIDGRNTVDASMFKAEWLGIKLQNAYPMAHLFEWFGSHSADLFLSGFWSYLLLEILLKARMVLSDAASNAFVPSYANVRARFGVGLLIFALPASASIYGDLTRHEVFTENNVVQKAYGELLPARAFEQTFRAKGDLLEDVSLYLLTFDRQNRCDIELEIRDAQGHSLARLNRSSTDLRTAWTDFEFQAIPVSRNQLYTLRLTSPNASSGNAVSWLSSAGDTFAEGQAIVDGDVQAADFTFRVGFAGPRLAAAH